MEKILVVGICLLALLITDYCIYQNTEIKSASSQISGQISSQEYPDSIGEIMIEDMDREQYRNPLEIRLSANMVMEFNQFLPDLLTEPGKMLAKPFYRIRLMNYHPHFYEMEMVSMIRQGPQQRLVHAAANTSRSRRCRGCLALRFVCGRTSCTWTFCKKEKSAFLPNAVGMALRRMLPAPFRSALMTVPASERYNPREIRLPEKETS